VLVALLEKGICGGGCGGLGKALEVLGEGEPYLAECRYGDYFAFCHPGPQYDYLVLRLDTSRIEGDHGPEDYKPSAVSKDLVWKRLVELRDVVCAIWERLRPLVLIFTTNPYLRAYTLGPGMMPWDVIEVAWRPEGAVYAKLIDVRELPDLEIPFVKVDVWEKPPTICAQAAEPAEGRHQ